MNVYWSSAFKADISEKDAISGYLLGAHEVVQVYWLNFIE
jgi:hypothetical protein